MEATRSLPGFHKIVLARAKLVFVVGKPRDCTVGAMRSCCFLATHADCIEEELVAGIEIVCEQTAAGCM